MFEASPPLAVTLGACGAVCEPFDNNEGFNPVNLKMPFVATPAIVSAMRDFLACADLSNGILKALVIAGINTITSLTSKTFND